MNRLDLGEARRERRAERRPLDRGRRAVRPRGPLGMYETQCVAARIGKPQMRGHRRPYQGGVLEQAADHIGGLYPAGQPNRVAQIGAGGPRLDGAESGCGLRRVRRGPCDARVVRAERRAADAVRHARRRHDGPTAPACRSRSAAKRRRKLNPGRHRDRAPVLRCVPNSIRPRAHRRTYDPSVSRQRPGQRHASPVRSRATCQIGRRCAPQPRPSRCCSLPARIRASVTSRPVATARQ